MEPPDKSNICKSNATISLPRYIADPGVAVTFKVVYSAMLPVDRTTREFNYTIGWDIVLPGLNHEGSLFDQKMDFFLRMGPGLSQMKDVLWASSA